jgi:hypothetical protein
MKVFEMKIMLERSNWLRGGQQQQFSHDDTIRVPAEILALKTYYF